MENKYYTPELSEFHIGFEYEYNPSLIELNLWYLDNNNNSNKWYSESFTAGNVLEGESEITEIQRLIESKAIRVKYLDLQDLEDLGFVKTDIGVFKNCYKKDSFVITNMEEYESNHVLDLSTYINKMARIFRASIRNKSELIKLLAQFTTRY